VVSIDRLCPGFAAILEECLVDEGLSNSNQFSQVKNCDAMKPFFTGNPLYPPGTPSEDKRLLSDYLNKGRKWRRLAKACRENTKSAVCTVSAAPLQVFMALLAEHISKPSLMESS
jgi:hypothetical protein